MDPQDLLTSVKAGDQETFDRLMAAHFAESSHRVADTARMVIEKIVRRAWGEIDPAPKPNHSFIREPRPENVSAFISLLEPWLFTQDREILHAFVFVWDFNFREKLLSQAQNPRRLMEQMEGHLLLDVDGEPSCDPLTNFLNCGLQVCVDALIEQAPVQKIISQDIHDLEEFLGDLTKPEHLPHALHFLRHMKHSKTPGWVGVFLAEGMHNRNTEVIRSLLQQEDFLPWAENAGLALHLRFTEVFAVSPHLLAQFETEFPPSLWPAVASNALRCATLNGRTPLAEWKTVVHHPMFDGNRVELVQDVLTHHFAKRCRYSQEYGQTAVALEECTRMRDPLLECLTDHEIDEWTTKQWYLDAYYCVRQHPAFLNRVLHAATVESAKIPRVLTRKI